MDILNFPLRVINNSGQSSIAGRLVKVNPARNNSFTLLNPNDTNMLGVIVEGGIANGQPCGVQVNGGVYVYVNGSVKQGENLKAVKPGEGAIKGVASSVKISDIEYLKVGIALESGANKLIFTALNPEYVSPVTSLAWNSITGKPNSYPAGVPPDYTMWDDTGHQTMYGQARPWRDELGDALGIAKNGVGLTTNIGEGTLDFDYNAAYNANPVLGDLLYKNVQLNHDKDLQASLYPHIHWFQAKNYIPNLLFEYRWQVNGGLKTTPWLKLKCNNLAFPYTPATTLNQISYSAPIPVPVGSTLSDIVQFRIFRDTGNVSGSFTGNCPYNTGGNASVPVLSFDCHFVINSLGSTDELVK